MSELTSVILPVFIVVGCGYLAVWRGLFSDAAVDALMRFAQTFAVPALLFLGVVRLDLSTAISPALWISYYTGAFASFAVCLFGARAFGRDWENSVAIGFCGAFTNTVLLGLPITERAFGVEALTGNFAIIAIHTPLIYGVGITLMEVVRARGAPLRQIPVKIGQSIFSNALIIGILLGFAVNLSGLPVPNVILDGLQLLMSAGIPAALFALGGVLYRYKPEGDFRIIGLVCVCALVMQPAITWVLAHWFDLSIEATRSAVLTAAMAPGVNVYLFAYMYGVALRVSASVVLIGTAACLVSAWGWLTILS